MTVVGGLSFTLSICKDYPQTAKDIKSKGRYQSVQADLSLNLGEGTQICIVLQVLSYQPRHEIFQQCGILTSVDPDEPVQPPVKLRNSK